MTVQMQAESPRVPHSKSCSSPTCPSENPQPLYNFVLHATGKYGRHPMCNHCRLAYQRDYYRKQNPDKFRKPKLGCGEITYAAPEGEEPYAIIPLHGKYGTGKVAKVSLEDVSKVNKHRWYLTSLGYVYTYVANRKGQIFKRLHLHRFVMDAEENQVIDHKEHDQLDNRRSMLRRCTTQQNTRNRRSFRNLTSPYKGVTQQKESKTFRAVIIVENQQYSLGSYETAEEAAYVYDKAARFHFGEFALTNFPGVESASVEEIAKACRERRQKQKSCPYRGVHRHKLSWQAAYGGSENRLHLGNYESPEEAAKAYDAIARYMQGSAAQTNFPGIEATSPDELIKRYRKRYGSAYIGVTPAHGNYAAHIKIQGEYHHLGSYQSEEEAAKMFDLATRYFYGTEAKTNFDGSESKSPEEIMRAYKPPRVAKSKSGFVGVRWDKRRQSFYSSICQGDFYKYLGASNDPEPLARAYDDARAELGLPRVNFPEPSAP